MQVMHAQLDAKQLFSRKKLTVVLLSLSCFGWWCYDELSKPNWVRYAGAADKAFRENKFDEADKQAKLMLAEADKYGGQMPPPAPQPWYAYFTLMQDRGEVFGYTGCLRYLGNKYQYDAYRPGEAEVFYRKALQLDCAHCGWYSEQVSHYALPPLIFLLEENNRASDALRVQQQYLHAEYAARETPQ